MPDFTQPTTWWEAAAREFEAPIFRTPHDVQRIVTPDSAANPDYLKLVDKHLSDVLSGACDRLILSIPPQSGKALALTTPIPTPTGWTALGDLRRGDTIFDRHGNTCHVTWLSEVFTDRPCYEVTTGDGESIVADAAHEWFARLDSRSPERIVETTTLAKPRGKNAKITARFDLDLPEADLPLDPYVLGVWLGDGTTIAASITTPDLDIVERIRAAGIPCRKMAGNPYGWTLVPGGWGSKASPFRQTLVSLGVWGNKHVPAAYLRGSHKQRLALLQGLIDTDGYVDPRKGQIEFCSTRRELAEAVRELAYSLGAKAVMHEGRAMLYGKDCGPKFRVMFMLKDAAWLPRKAQHTRDSTVGHVRYVKAAVTASVPTRCIEVDSPDHSYLAGRTFLPTHNSERVIRSGLLWWLHHRPQDRVVVASFEKTSAERWGRTARNDINAHPELGLRIRRDSRAAGRWDLEPTKGRQGGSLFCVGVGGPITGKPVDLLLVDDPVKGRAWAESATYRDMEWAWWSSDARTRLGANSKVIAVGTRWHSSDLLGLIQEREPGRWRVVNIPALAEADDPLGRDVGDAIANVRGQTRETYEETRDSIGPYAFASLYQGRPAPAEGGLFKRADLRYYERPDGATERRLQQDAAPGEVFLLDGRPVWLRDCYLFATVDLAASTKTSADYTVASMWAHTVDGNLLLLDMVRARVDDTRHGELILPLVRRWDPDFVGVEDSGRSVNLATELGRAGIAVRPLKADVDKVTRALPGTARVARHQLWLPRTADSGSWLEPVIGELLSFPNGKNDDFTDTYSYAARIVLGSNAGAVSVSVPSQTSSASLLDALGPAGIGNARPSRGGSVDWSRVEF